MALEFLSNLASSVGRFFSVAPAQKEAVARVASFTADLGSVNNRVSAASSGRSFASLNESFDLFPSPRPPAFKPDIKITPPAVPLTGPEPSISPSTGGRPGWFARAKQEWADVFDDRSRYAQGVDEGLTFSELDIETFPGRLAVKIATPAYEELLRSPVPHFAAAAAVGVATESLGAAGATSLAMSRGMDALEAARLRQAADGSLDYFGYRQLMRSADQAGSTGWTLWNYAKEAAADIALFKQGKTLSSVAGVSLDVVETELQAKKWRAMADLTGDRRLLDQGLSYAGGAAVVGLRMADALPIVKRAVAAHPWIDPALGIAGAIGGNALQDWAAPRRDAYRNVKSELEARYPQFAPGSMRRSMYPWASPAAPDVSPAQWVPAGELPIPGNVFQPAEPKAFRTVDIRTVRPGSTPQWMEITSGSTVDPTAYYESLYGGPEGLSKAKAAAKANAARMGLPEFDLVEGPIPWISTERMAGLPIGSLPNEAHAQGYYTDKAIGPDGRQTPLLVTPSLAAEKGGTFVAHELSHLFRPVNGAEGWAALQSALESRSGALIGRFADAAKSQPALKAAIERLSYYRTNAMEAMTGGAVVQRTSVIRTGRRLDSEEAVQAYLDDARAKGPERLEQEGYPADFISIIKELGDPIGGRPLLLDLRLTAPITLGSLRATTEFSPTMA